MKIRSIFIALVNILCFLSVTNSYGHLGDEYPLRVLLSSFEGAIKVSVRARHLETSSDGTIWTPNAADVLTIVSPMTKNSNLPTNKSTKRTMYFRSGDGLPVSLETSGQRRSYKGVIRADISDSITMVNIIGVESYLSDAVGAEMPSTFPVEALKAQAIASRSYSYSYLNKHIQKEADLCDTTHCQVYHGVRHSESVSSAVRETAGVILSLHDKPFPSQYSASCGGYLTEDKKLGPNSCKPDSLDGINILCESGDSYRWKKEFTQRDLMQKLRINGDAITKISILERDCSGRVQIIEIHSNMNGNNITRLTGIEVRTRLLLKSTRFNIEVDKENGDLIFVGNGYGHGIGMCQWGARKLAMPPYNLGYKEILNHYFPGTTLSIVKIDSD